MIFQAGSASMALRRKCFMEAGLKGQALAPNFHDVSGFQIQVELVWCFGVGNTAFYA